jgi:uncharacterized protein
LILSAADDPIAPPGPYVERQLGDWIQLIVTPRGGHVGFVAGTPWKPRFWAEDVALSFLDQHAHR